MSLVTATCWTTLQEKSKLQNKHPASTVHCLWDQALHFFRMATYKLKCCQHFNRGNFFKLKLTWAVVLGENAWGDWRKRWTLLLKLLTEDGCSIRGRRHNVPILQFLLPWPATCSFCLLPPLRRSQIIRGKTFPKFLKVQSLFHSKFC